MPRDVSADRPRKGDSSSSEDGTKGKKGTLGSDLLVLEKYADDAKAGGEEESTAQLILSRIRRKKKKKKRKKKETGIRA